MHRRSSCLTEAPAFHLPAPVVPRRCLAVNLSHFCFVRKFPRSLALHASPSRLQRLLPRALTPAPHIPSAVLATAVSSPAAASTPFAVWTVLISAATLGLTSQSTSLGAALSPPLVSILTTLFLSNLNLIPPAHPIYSSVTSILVPLAVPLLLFAADLRRILTDTGRLLRVFVVGAFATLIATYCAWHLVPLTSLGDSAWKIATALCARHVGGAVNYVAVVEATKAPAALVTSALAADNVIVALYFLVLLLLARSISAPPPRVIATEQTSPEHVDDDTHQQTLHLNRAAISLSLSAAICAVAAFVSHVLPWSLGTIPVATAFTLTLATLFPNLLRPYTKSAAALGTFFMQIFFAVTGAGAPVLTVLRDAPVLLVFSSVQLAIHLFIMLTVAKLARFHRAEVLVASNANVGGPTTAAAMASAKKWDSLVAPAILVGVFGYSIATFLSLGLGYFFLRG